ncbi:MAG TPA: pyruvate kinase [Acidimicrobiaceae bacterium]|nr:pyruvate kinase [Acidimicrobiaceae bacterium]HCB37668.1 pyruvate kinase [Acidimicrobiaceae bacterium]
MARRTKIIATIGPACEDEATLRGIIEAGADVIRLGLAHGELDEQIEKYHRIRHVSKQLGRYVGILVDLPGPKVRCASFPEGGSELVPDDIVELTPDGDASTAERVVVDYEGLLTDVGPGDRLAFGDGNVVLTVVGRDGDILSAQVVHGGHLEGRPGVHIASDRLRMTSPTKEDLRFADVFIDLGCDMLAVSFVRSAHDMRSLGVEPAPRGPLLVAKIETRAAVENLEGIIEASGAVMVARGDLGSECDIEELPHLQKSIIEACISLGRPAITATQMLESLLSAPAPTRAEASDVANAVFDGTSAVMLSGETAIGRDPVNAVATMARIAGRADESFDYAGWADRIGAVRSSSVAGEEYQRFTDALTMAASRVATALEANAIMCLSRSGFTARSMARFRPSMPMVGLTPDVRTAHQLSLSWGVQPLVFAENWSPEENATQAAHAAAAAGAVRSGDVVVVVSGSSSETHATDTLRVMRVP